MKTKGIDWDAAQAIVEAVRPIIMPHALIKKSILEHFKLWPYDEGGYADQEEA